MDIALEDPIEIGGEEISNRLYRAPLLEHAGDGEEAADILIDELEPCAEGGVGLIMQGSMPVRGGGEGCAAPGMTPANDPDFVEGLSALPEAIKSHGAKIFGQIGHGGIKSLETWHGVYKAQYPDLKQISVSELPWIFRAGDALGILDFDIDVMSTDDVYKLAEDFGVAAENVYNAGYDGIHIAGATAGLLQQFASPVYNKRTDEFGGSLENRSRFYKEVIESIRDRIGDAPVTTKVPAETDTPLFVRNHITLEDGIEMCCLMEDYGYDAVTPVTESPFWDQSIIKGNFPDRAWNEEKFQEGYREAFGGGFSHRVVKLAARMNSVGNQFKPAWNEEFCKKVRERVDIPVLQVGGIRDRDTIDGLLERGACDMVGMGRPFYAEPRLAARLLNDEDSEVICNNCNNCIPPQVAGEKGVCRTPSVLRRRGELEKEGAYN